MLPKHQNLNKLYIKLEWQKQCLNFFNAFILGTVTGGLCAKIFRRTAVLGEKAPILGAPAAQSQRLNVPRRTKAFIDQSLHERDFYQRMHQVTKIVKIRIFNSLLGLSKRSFYAEISYFENICCITKR